MLFISETESAALVTHELAFVAAREALIAACEPATASFPVVLGHGSSTANRFTVKAAATAELAGLKVGSYWPGNRDRGLERHNSLILLFDQETGRIDTAIEAGISTPTARPPPMPSRPMRWRARMPPPLRSSGPAIRPATNAPRWPGCGRFAAC